MSEANPQPGAIGAPTLPAGTVLGGDFELLRPLAAGGMGAVYVALQRTTGRQRAIKTMHPEYVSDPTMRERFAREATASARVDSDHVVEVLAAGVDDATGVPWIAMELLSGDDLAKTVKSRGPLSREHASLVARQLGHALSAAHRAGVVHRDLKPDNVMLSTPRVDGVPFTVKVLDFGIARFIHQTSVSATTSAIGSPLWMSPEQTDTSLPITPATDVWAFGLIAFFMLTGQYFWLTPARPNPSVAAMLRELLVDPIPAASARAAELGVSRHLPAGFDAWFARAADREPSRRFSDVSEAAQSLAALLAAAPAAQPPLAAPTRYGVAYAPTLLAPLAPPLSTGPTPAPPLSTGPAPLAAPPVTAQAPLYPAAPTTSDVYIATVTSPRPRRRWPLVAALAAVAVPAAAGAWVWTSQPAPRRPRPRPAVAVAAPAPAPPPAPTPAPPPAPALAPVPAPPPAPAPALPSESSSHRPSRRHERQDPAGLDRQTLMRVLGRRSRRGGACARDIPTRSLWDQQRAERRCPWTCERRGGQWTGRWGDQRSGQGSVCTCRFEGAACR